jgi:hypothetical protein
LETRSVIQDCKLSILACTSGCTPWALKGAKAIIKRKKISGFGSILFEILGNNVEFNNTS